MIFKRGEFYWYKFTWDGRLVRNIDALSEPKRKKASVTEFQQDARNSGYLLVATNAERLQASPRQ